jgi:hypothetical protein
MQDAEQSLRQRAQSGDGVGQLELAMWLYDRGTADEALYWLGQSAKQGTIAAFTELGARLVVGAGAPKAPADGMQMLSIAANNGDALAARYLSNLHATGHGAPRDWPAAVDWLRRSAAAGDADSKAELKLLEKQSKAKADDAIIASWLAAPAVEWLSEDPKIGVVRKFLPPAQCAWLIDGARQMLQPAGVTDAASGSFAADPARTNRYAQVRLFDYPLPLLLLREQMAQVVGEPTDNFETMNILAYEPGEEYKPHHDYLDPDAPGFQLELETRGQRVATFLVYLNDDFEGGETSFPDLDIRFRGRTGDALFFISATADGVIDPRTRHAGLPPTSGTKWLLSQWVRNRAQSVY